MAKGINSGYIPLGAMSVRQPIGRLAGRTGTSAAGSPALRGIRSRAPPAVASINIFREEGIV